ncbi:PAS domain-containing protein [Crassaminicella thermophila]|uniref:PAS domain-containing protein n=1 Tax=Crassaminicella thermophila TaxID=2599308 RepID=A0A5C0SDB6_CRATE|nr:sigma 54-interacting transcriptional regulator [Crassaminicella thermophila]QEK12535.1 PAS domain-containing protein [Crassaminicella thermophila]
MNLMKIISSVQKIAEAIESVLKVDVTIVDNHLNRIAATGRYKKNIGEKVNKNSVFGFALRQGESFIIENPRNHDACLKCENIKSCKEYAEVCCPIKVNDQIFGVIGLIAFEEEQRDALIKNKTNLMEFLNRMGDLIASKLLDKQKTDKIKLLARELETVLDSVDRGIIAVDKEGWFLRYNKKAAQLFQIDENRTSRMNIKDLLENLNFSNLVMQNICVKNREFRYKRKHYHFRGVFDANPIVIEGKTFGIVFTFSNISEILNVVNDIATGTIITSFENIIGNSHCLEAVKLEAQKAAKTTSTVLIQGESGTGKELFARAIHFHSNRYRGPFIPINCAAIPEQLLESELFGYEEGAFTGSKKGGKTGKFELANKGTLFLDEIGDMPIHLQTKLLRVLQEYVIEKVGGKEFIPIDVRVIAATNKNLEQKVLEGEFREDLFYRLNVIPLNIPPLRKRKEDIVILVKYLLSKCNRKLGKNIKEIDTYALEILINYDWPGNVRELENTIEYAVNMCSSHVIKDIDLPNRLTNTKKSFKETKIEKIIPIKELEIKEIKKAIEYFGNTKQAIPKAAEALGMSRATLYRKLKEYKIKQS